MTTRTWQDALIREPARLITSQPAQVGISALSMLFTAIFFAAPLLAVEWLHPWLIFAVAACAALGVEYAFLKGISDRAFVEAHGGRGIWGDVLIFTTGGLLIVAGSTVLLTYAYKLEAFVSPPTPLAVALALLHIVPLALIGVCSAQLHAAAERHQHEAERQREDEEMSRAARIRADDDERKRKWQERMSEIEAEKRAALARVATWEEEQAAKLRASAQRAAQRGAHLPAQPPAQSPHGAFQRAMSREELVAAVRAAYGADANFSRADMARRTGWSEAMVRKILKEL